MDKLKLNLIHHIREKSQLIGGVYVLSPVIIALGEYIFVIGDILQVQ